MKLAFLILVHRYPQQVGMLINTLLMEEYVTVFVHVDAKSKGVLEELKREFSQNPNVVFTPDQYKVYWGSYNQIKATVLLMKTAVEHGNFDYYTLISGQDMLIKPLAQFKDFLRLNNGKEFMVYFKLPAIGNWEGNGGLDRLQLFWVDVKGKNYNYIYGKVNAVIHKAQNLFNYKRKLTYELYGGVNWFTLTHNAVSYITDFLKTNTRYLQRYKYTRCADEIFTQTILQNSPFKHQFVNDDLRYVNWADGPEYPKTLRDEDYSVLTTIEDKFFARKFDATVDNTIIAKLISFVSKKAAV